MADKEIRVDLRLTGLEEFRSALGDVGDAAGDLGSSFSDFGSAVGDVVTSIGEIVLAAGAATAAMVGFAVSNAEAIDNMVKLSEKTGVATEDIEKYGFIAESVNLTTDELADAFLQLSIAMGKEKVPAGDLEELLKKQQRERGKLGKILADNEKAYERLRKETDKSIEKQRAQNLQIQLFNDQNPKFAKSLKVIDDGQDRIAASTERANERYEAQQERLREINGEVEDFGKANTKLGKILKSVSPALHEQFTTASSTGEAFKVLINGMRGLSKETQNLIAANAFKNLNIAQIARLSAEEIENLSKKFEELGGATDEVAKRNAVLLGDKLDILRQGFRKFGEELTNIYTPEVILAGDAVEEFLVKNRESFLTLAREIIPDTIKVFKDLFQLFTKGTAGQNPSETAVQIHSTYVKLKPIIDGVATALKIFWQQIDQIAKSFGFASGQQAAITLAILKFTGVLNLGIQTVLLFINTIKFFGANMKLIATAVEFFLSPFGLFLIAVGAVAFAIDEIVKATIGWEAAQAQLGLLLIDTQDVLNRMIDSALLWANTVIFTPEHIDQANDFLNLMGRVITSFGGMVVAAAEWTAAKVFSEENELAAGNFLLLMADVITAFGGMVDAAGRWVAAKIVDATTVQAVKDFFADLKLIPQAFDNMVAAAKRFVDVDIFASFNAKVDSVLQKLRGVAASLGLVSTPEPTAPNIPRKAAGGKITGKGTGTSDSILARLSNGEYVVNAASVKQYGTGLLNAINSGVLNLKGFADGGLADFANSLSGQQFQPAFAGGRGGGSSGRPLNLVLPNGNSIKTLGVDNNVAKALEKELRGSASAKITQLPEWWR